MADKPKTVVVATKRKSFLLHWVIPTIVLGVIGGFAYKDCEAKREKRETQRMLNE